MIERGELVQVGPHVVGCFDLEQGYPQPPQAAVVYTDPPYTKALASGFRTKANKADPTIERKSVDFDGLLKQALGFMGPLDAPVFMEMGDSTQERFLNLADEAGWVVVQSWPITYYGKHRCWLNLLGLVGMNGARLGNLPLAGMDDAKTPYAVIEAATQPGDWVIDCFLGQGLTAIAAHRLGRRCWGMELNPARAGAAVNRLEALVSR